MDKNNKVIISSIGLMALICILGLSYAFFTAESEGVETETTITTGAGSMRIVYDTGEPSIAALDIAPSTEPFATKTFTITGTNTIEDLEMAYKVSLVIDENTFTNNALSYTLTSTNTANNGIIIPSVTQRKAFGSSSFDLGRGNYDGGVTSAVHSYELKLYFYETDGNQNVDKGKSFKAHIGVEALKAIISPTELFIDIADGMIPVTYNAAGETIKADSTKTDGSWYDYAAYKWANVVLLNSDANRNTYNASAVGTVIPESAIAAYYVWIPRYSYTLFNVNENGDSTAPEQQIKVTLQTPFHPVYQGTTNGSELTHPAFWWDKNDNDVRETGEEVNGFWVGKFELTGNITTPTIKPNLSSLRSQTVSTLWGAIEKFKTNPIYGLNTSSLDSHMMKNVEWGAVAYLSQSKYGNYSNPATGNEIFINPSNSYITGRSGNTVSQAETTDTSGAASGTLYSWNGKSCLSKIGYECTGAIQSLYGPTASTTGTIYGVYDMSGGGVEYVMGNMSSSTANFNSHEMYASSAGTAFGSYNASTLPKRYYDIYDYGTTYNVADAYKRGKLGDATKEILQAIGTTGAWNTDYAHLPNSSNSWFFRGGNYNDSAKAGVWLFNAYSGAIYINNSARSVVILNP